MAAVTRRRELLDVVATPDPIAAHAVEHDFPSTTVLRLAQPLEGVAVRLA